MPANPDGSLRPYNPSEVAAFKLKTRGIRDGSNPSERYSPDGSGCERPWQCDWNLRTECIKYLVGEVVKYTNTGTGLPTISRTQPQTHPTFTNWWCTQARITGYKFVSDDSTTGGVGNKMPTYQAAELMVNYEQVPMRFVDDAEVVTEQDRYTTKPGHIGAEVTVSGSEFGPLPGGIMQYKTSDASPPNNVPLPYNVSIIEAEGRFSAIWHRIPEFQFQAGTPLFTRLFGDPVGGTRPWVGSANSTVLFGRPPATCLLEGVEPKLRPDPTGFGYSWDIKYTWRYKAQTWFRILFFDPKGIIAPGYQVIMKAGAAYTAPASMGDTDSLYYLRDHATGLWSIS